VPLVLPAEIAGFARAARLPEERQAQMLEAGLLRKFALLAGCHRYPDTMGYGEQFEAIVRAWRSAARQDVERGETL
jgi:hypothetical protein